MRDTSGHHHQTGKCEIHLGEKHHLNPRIAAACRWWHDLQLSRSIIVNTISLFSLICREGRTIYQKAADVVSHSEIRNKSRKKTA
jgi:hypothetical protein